MSDEPRLSATVIAQNEEMRIADCLDSLRFCDEVIVIDGGSTDRTREIAKDKGARVIERAFDHFAGQHQFANENARGRWVVSLDADERVTPELATQLRTIADAPEPAPHAAYSLPFQNHFRSIPLRHGGLSPDRHLRFFRRDLCRIDPARTVHEKLLVPEGPDAIGQLDSLVLHFGWLSVSQALGKSERYAERAAQALHASGKRGSLVRMVGKPIWRFLRGYFFQLGLLDGAAGALVAGLRAHEAFVREARLWELTRFSDPRAGPLE